jgi:hypothetical protein
MKIRPRFDGEFFKNAGPNRRKRLMRRGRVAFLGQGYESLSYKSADSPTPYEFRARVLEGYARTRQARPASKWPARVTHFPLQRKSSRLTREQRISAAKAEAFMVRQAQIMDAEFKARAAQ